MFKKDLYLLAYREHSIQGGSDDAGNGGETADGMSEEKIEEIAELCAKSATDSPRPEKLHTEKEWQALAARHTVMVR